MMKLLSLVFLAFSMAFVTDGYAADFKVKGTAFVLDGKPFQIRAGEMHYPRVPKEEWRNRIVMAKAMGLNTICTYVFWNLHESKRGEYDFSGERDVLAFVKLCGELGMHAIVRPGPYVCAEWDLGGLPAWLLAEPGIKLRSTDPRYLDPAKAWMKKMGGMLQPLSVAQGGPLLMVQIENEFGNFGADPEYLEALQAALRSGGYQGTVFTCDTASEKALQNGGRLGVLQATNFGGGAEKAFQNLQKVSPGQPNLTMEFWVGWFDQWGRPHHLIEPQEKLADLEWMMRTGASFNLYMFHGGTTRGLWTGANWEGHHRPITCSYDYSAPLDESGRPTAKYYAFRSMIQDALKGEGLPEVPSIASTGSIGPIQLTEQCRLIDAIPSGQISTALQTLETLSQTTGFLSYRMMLEGPLEGELGLGSVKDRVYVVMDGKLQGISGRSTNGSATVLKVPEGSHRLDLLVENMGRINYGNQILEERKGLTSPILFAGKELGPFEQVGLPMQHPPLGKYEEIKQGKTFGSATLYRGKFEIGSPCDTWLDTRGFGRGMIWFNGRSLGRFWKAGPSQAVFLPGCWMKNEGENEIVMLELESEISPSSLPTSAKAIWGNGN